MKTWPHNIGKRESPLFHAKKRKRTQIVSLSSSIYKAGDGNRTHAISLEG